MRAPRVQILSISCISWENLAKLYVGVTPPLRVGAPTVGKSWIPHYGQSSSRPDLTRSHLFTMEFENWAVEIHLINQRSTFLEGFSQKVD